MSKYKSLCYIKTYHPTSLQQELPWWSTFLLAKMEYKNALPEQTYTKFVPIFSPCLHLPMDLIILLISNYFKDWWVHLASMTTDHRWTGSGAIIPVTREKWANDKKYHFFKILARLQPKDVSLLTGRLQSSEGFPVFGWAFQHVFPCFHSWELCSCALILELTLGTNKTSLVLWRMSRRGNVNKDKAT